MAVEKREKRSFFVRLLSFLLGRDIDSGAKGSRALKSIQKQLNKAGYKFFILKKDMVTAQFAKFIYQVYAAVAPFREFFLQNTQDDFYAAQILNSSLDDDQLELVAKLSPENIQLLASRIELKSLADQGMAFFVALRDGVEKQHAHTINESYNSLVIMKQFCLLDYYVNLRKFHGVFRENSFEEIPKFDTIALSYVKEFVLDFLSSVSVLLSVADWSGVFAFLQKFSGLNYQVFAHFKQLIEQFRIMETARVFENMFRLVTYNEEAELSVASSSRDIVKPYLEGIYQEFRSAVEEIHHNHVIENQKKLVDDVFAGRTLVPLKFYNQKENEKYAESQAHGFAHCNAILYLNSFYELYFHDEFSKFVETFEIVADCNKPNYVSDFCKLYHELSEQKASVAELDTKLDTKFAEGYKLNSLFLRLGVNESVLLNFNMEMDAVNLRARAIIERSLKTLQKILVFYEEMVNERVHGSFDIISNWDELNNKFENGCLTLLKRTKNHITTFLALMKNFQQLE